MIESIYGGTVKPPFRVEVRCGDHYVISSDSKVVIGGDCAISANTAHAIVELLNAAHEDRSLFGNYSRVSDRLAKALDLVVFAA